MTLSVADGTLAVASLGQVPGVTTFTVSGLSFQPKAGFLFWNGRGSDGQGEADAKWGQGIFTSTTSRRAYTTQQDHGVGTSATDHARYDDSVVAILTTAGAVDGKLDLDAITSDGFRLIVDDAISIDLQLGWIVWGGADLTDVEIVDFTEPAATGDQDIAVTFALNTGLDDKAVLFLGSASAAMGTVSAHSVWSLGAAAGNTIANAVAVGTDIDAQGISVTFGYGKSGECIANTGAGNAVTSRAGVSAWLSTGFRLNWTEVDGSFAWGHSALVMKGGRWEVGTALTATDTTNQTEGTTYVPKGLLVASACRAESTADTTTDHDQRSVGVATSASSRRYASLMSVDNLTTMDIGIAYDDTQMYANQSTDATIVTEGTMDLVSLDATPGFTYVMDDADPSANWFWYLSCADTPAAGGARQQTLSLLGVGI